MLVVNYVVLKTKCNFIDSLRAVLFNSFNRLPIDGYCSESNRIARSTIVLLKRNDQNYPRFGYNF